MSVIINGIRYVPALNIKMPSEFGTLGEALRTMRKDARLSLKAAAVEIGCSKTYLWGVEKSGMEPSLRMAARMSAAYGVPLATLAACLPAVPEKEGGGDA